MDKDILEEPLKDAKQNYEKVLGEDKDKLSKEDFDRYTLQLNCINEIMDLLKTNPNDKDKMIEKFEKM